MIDLSATIEAMRSAGLSDGDVLKALAAIRTVPLEPSAGNGGVSAGNPQESSRLAKLRAYDRERKRAKKDAGGQSAPVEPPAEIPRNGETPPIEILPSVSIDSEGKESVIAREGPVATRWEVFKATYPKRAGDYDWKKARQKYERLIASGIPEQELINGARRYALWAQAEGKVGTQYVRQPPTWLNNEGWKNDYTASPKNGIMGALDDLERRLAPDHRTDDGPDDLQRIDPARGDWGGPSGY